MNSDLAINNLGITNIPIAMAQNENLTLEARGLLTFILSLPTNWNISKDWIRTQCPKLGRDKLDRIWKELREAGYIEKIQIHSDDGAFSGLHWRVRVDKSESEKIPLLTLKNTRPIAFHRPFLYLGLNVSAGVFLSQVCYWSENRTTIDRDGWFYKTADDWFEETGLTRREQEGARKKLRDLGILEEKRQGLPAKLFFRVNHDVLHKLLLEVVKTNEY